MSELEDRIKDCRNAIESEFEEPYVSRELALECLRAAEWRLRATALVSLKRVWLLRPDEIQLICVGLIDSDAHCQVRAIAIGILGNYYRSTKNQTLCKYLAKIALSSSRTMRERRAAAVAVDTIHSDPLDIATVSEEDFNEYMGKLHRRIRSSSELFSDQELRSLVKLARDY